MRDEFSQRVKDNLGKRVGFLCSNPGCGMPTVGPHSNSASATNIGVAAHITAASPGGPRYDPTTAEDVRSAIENGIWLCQSCAKLIDSDLNKYSVDTILDWKRQAERKAGDRLNKQLAGADWGFGREGNLESIQENGYYEKQMEDYKIRYFLQDNNLHVEQELANGSIGYYVIDSRGNMLEQKFPYELSEYSVEIDPSLILKRDKQILPDGLVQETISMKWGKRALLVWDSAHRLVHCHFDNGVRIDNVRKVFVLESPEFKSSYVK